MTSKELYFNLLEYARPYWKMFALSLVAMVLLAATQPILPAFMKPLLDESFVAKNLKSIGIMPILLVVLFIVRGIASFVSTTAMAWVSSRVVMDLRADMFNRILELPKAYFDKHATGNLISKVTFNVDQVTNAVTSSLIILLRDSLTIIGLLGWMFYLDWKLSLIFFVIVPVAGTMVKLAANRLRRLSRSLNVSPLRGSNTKSGKARLVTAPPGWAGEGGCNGGTPPCQDAFLWTRTRSAAQGFCLHKHILLPTAPW